MEQQTEAQAPKKRFRNRKSIIIVILLLILFLILSIGSFLVFRYFFSSNDQIVKDEADEQRFVVIEGDSLNDITSALDEYSLFNEALTNSGISEELKKDGEYTIFMPTNSVVEAYLKENNVSKGDFTKGQKVKELLSNHILPKKILAQELADLDSIETIQGKKLVVSQDEEGNPTVEGVKIIEIDIEGSNGVIHVVEKVISPK